MNTNTLFRYDWLSVFGLLHGRVPNDTLTYLVWDKRVGVWAVGWFIVVMGVAWLWNRQQMYTAVPRLAPTHPDQQWRLAP